MSVSGVSSIYSRAVNVAGSRQRSVNVAELEMASRHHQLISHVAKANEDVQRASVVTMETQIVANKASHRNTILIPHFSSNVLSSPSSSSSVC